MGSGLPRQRAREVRRGQWGCVRRGSLRPEACGCAVGLTAAQAVRIEAAMELVAGLPQADAVVEPVGPFRKHDAVVEPVGAFREHDAAWNRWGPSASTMRCGTGSGPSASTMRGDSDSRTTARDAVFLIATQRV
jgi:hypothetical protein